MEMIIQIQKSLYLFPLKFLSVETDLRKVELNKPQFN